MTEGKLAEMVREVAWNHYWQGYKLGSDTENYSGISKRTARHKFERYWERNHE